MSLQLPAVPEITLRKVTRDIDPLPFLHVDRHWLVAGFPNGSESGPFGYDSVSRRALDAVVIVVWRRVDDDVAVYLRTAVRPPLLERDGHPGAVEPQATAGIWELPAGLIEPEELPPGPERLAGVLRAAARETEEELGFSIAAECFVALGGGVFPSPAMTGERQYFAHVEVHDEVAAAPSLDGSPLEEHAAIALVPLQLALTWCEQGAIMDSKTELGLRRLAALLGRR